MRVYLLGTAVAACWLAVSRLHRLQSCDSLVFGLASLYEWTPYFWEQDRVGLLVPLLAAPVRDPFANLAVQTGLMSFCGLLVPLLLARLVCPHPGAYAAVTLGNALLVAAGPLVVQENVLTTCVYPLALCLGLPAVGLLDRPTGPRALLAAGLLLVAHWVYLGVGVFLVPLAAGRWLFDPTRPRFRSALGVALGAAGSMAIQSLLADVWRHVHPEVPSTPSSGLPVADWPDNWWGFARALGRHDGFAAWGLAVAGVAAAGALVPAARSRAEVRAVLPLLVAAAAELLLLGTRAWPAMNEHHPRYLLAALPAVWVGVLVATWGPVLRNWPKWSAGASFGLLAASILWQYGPPSPAAARAELDALFGRDAADLDACRADAFGGEYMAVWPTVWHAAMARPDRPLVGVTAKAAPWVWRWRDGPLRGGFRLAAPFDQEDQARRWISNYGLVVVAGPEPHGRLVVLTVMPSPGP